MESSDNAATNHGENNSPFHDSPSYDHNRDNLHHGTLSLTSILLIVIPIILVVLLTSIIILIILLRRQKSVKCNSLSRNSNNIDDISKFDSHTTINFTESPGKCCILIYVRSALNYSIPQSNALLNCPLFLLVYSNGQTMLFKSRTHYN